MAESFIQIPPQLHKLSVEPEDHRVGSAQERVEYFRKVISLDLNMEIVPIVQKCPDCLMPPFALHDSSAILKARDHLLLSNDDLTDRMA